MCDCAASEEAKDKSETLDANGQNKFPCPPQPRQTQHQRRPKRPKGCKAKRVSIYEDEADDEADDEEEHFCCARAAGPAPRQLHQPAVPRCELTGVAIVRRRIEACPTPMDVDESCNETSYEENGSSSTAECYEKMESKHEEEKKEPEKEEERDLQEKEKEDEEEVEREKEADTSNGKGGSRKSSKDSRNSRTGGQSSPAAAAQENRSREGSIGQNIARAPVTSTPCPGPMNPELDCNCSANTKQTSPAGQ